MRACRRYGKRKAKACRATEENLKARVVELRTAVETTPREESKALSIELKKVSLDLNMLEDAKAQGWALRAKHAWAKGGDLPGKFFFSKVKA